MTAARQRAERYAAMAPAGTKVEIADSNRPSLEMSQVTIKGDFEYVILTISSRPGDKRTRAGCSWILPSGRTTEIKVRDIAYMIRNVFVRKEDS